MSRRTKIEYLQRMQARYAEATAQEKEHLLDEVCQMCDYHRKHAIRKLNGPPIEPDRKRRPSKRGVIYRKQTISILKSVWEAAGYPWSIRLHALLPLWMPWIRQHFRVPQELEQQLLQISPRQMDRRLQPYKAKLRRRIYGRTKPGRLLKHEIPIRAERWNVDRPGWLEVDLVPHAGNSASGEFLYSLNVTDIYSTWVETRAVLGKSQRAVQAALAEIFAALPFPVLGIDSDNGSEFINDHLYRYCRQHHIHFTRGRPYKKDDNAHVEQKNWTHVRRLLGWERYDSPAALKAINAFYRNEWRVMMNVFQPSVKLQGKVRVGSRLRRRYGTPHTPFERLQRWGHAPRERMADLERLAQTCDPLDLAKTIERKLDQIYDLAAQRYREPQRKKSR